MNKYKYESVHDLKDIMLMIYDDCKDYAVKYWNYIDGEHMEIAFTGVKKHSDGFMEVCFKAYPEGTNPISFLPKTVGQWQEMLKRLETKTPEWDAAKVTVTNAVNGKDMTICFTGSSNVTKEVNYTLGYVDPGWRIWKFKARVKASVAAYKAKKVLNAGKCALDTFRSKLSEPENV